MWVVLRQRLIKIESMEWDTSNFLWRNICQILLAAFDFGKKIVSCSPTIILRIPYGSIYFESNGAKSLVHFTIWIIVRRDLRPPLRYPAKSFKASRRVGSVERSVILVSTEKNDVIATGPRRSGSHPIKACSALVRRVLIIHLYRMRK